MNAVEDGQDLQVKWDVKDIHMPMRLVYEALVKARHLKGKQRKEEEEIDQGKCYCQYHDKTTDHSIQECPKFRKMIQEMINGGEIEFLRKYAIAKCERLIKKSPKAIYCLLSRGRSTSNKGDDSGSHS